MVSNWDPYDGLNRPTRKFYTGGAPTPEVRYCYDGQAGNPCSGARAAPNFGRLTWIGAGESSTSYAHDLLGRVTQSTQTTAGQGYTSTYGYDLAANVKSLTYPTNDRLLAALYDGAGRLTELKDNTNPSAPRLYVSSPSYAPHGELASMLLGNSRWEHAAFNTRLQPTEIGLGTSSSDFSFLRMNYGYATTQNNGNVLSHTISRPGLPATATQSFAYDDFNRLEAAAETVPDFGLWYQNYDHDQYGNMWVTATNLPLEMLTPRTVDWFDAKNRIVGNNYDDSGNQTRAGGGTFTFDAENRMSSAWVEALPPSTSTFTYAYDGEGRRVKKVLYGRTTVYVYGAQGELLAEYKDGSLHKQFIYQGSRLLAVESSNPAGTSFLTADHLGSTRAVTDASGAVKSCHDYQPFGKEIPLGYGGRAAGSCYAAEERVLQRFTGQEVDPETGLQYFGARYYSGRQGRFSTADETLADQHPDDPQSWNLYTYVRNNPLRFTDADGRECKDGKDEKGDPCFTMTVSGRYYPQPISQALGALLQVEFGRQVQALQAASETAWNWLTAPRNLGCLSAATSAGAGIGMAGGAALGAAGGPFVPVTVPTGSGIGLVGGGAVGWFGGMIHCSSGTAPAGGSGPGPSAAGTSATARDAAVKRAFLRKLANDPKTPSWMKQWLQQGRVPPGYNVDHIKPLSVGGADAPSNMLLRLRADHVIHHRFYHPWKP